MLQVILLNMVTIRLQPIKEIIVHELVKVNTVDEFLNTKTGNIPLGGGANPVRWVDGILYDVSGFPPTPEVVKDQLDGVIHFAAVEFTEMKEYKPYLKNGINNVVLPITNMSHNAITKEIGQWLKKQLISE
jgi:hypothetical protein